MIFLRKFHEKKYPMQVDGHDDIRVVLNRYDCSLPPVDDKNFNNMFTMADDLAIQDDPRAGYDRADIPPISIIDESTFTRLSQNSSLRQDCFLQTQFWTRSTNWLCRWTIWIIVLVSIRPRSKECVAWSRNASCASKGRRRCSYQVVPRIRPVAIRGCGVTTRRKDRGADRARQDTAATGTSVIRSAVAPTILVFRAWSATTRNKGISAVGVRPAMMVTASNAAGVPDASTARVHQVGLRIMDSQSLMCCLADPSSITP